MKNSLNPDLCAFCGAPGVKAVYKDKLFSGSENAVIIENLPVCHCETCGESYYDPEVSRLIDEILAHPGDRAIRRQINVVSPAAFGVSDLAGLFSDDPTLREICEQAYQMRDADIQPEDR